MSLLKLELHEAVTDYAVDFRDPSVQVLVTTGGREVSRHYKQIHEQLFCGTNNNYTSSNITTI